MLPHIANEYATAFTYLLLCCIACWLHCTPMADSDLPPPRISAADAQATPVVRLPAFLTPDEVAEIDAFHAATSDECGRVAKASCAVTGAALWTTTYLSTDRRFNARFPGLLQRMLAAARASDVAHFGDFGSGAVLAPRVVEYHTVLPGGALKHEKHYDSGSVYTVDIMLARPGDDFDGGEFVSADTGDKPCFVNSGDAIVFCSHKYHSVRPVTRGTRRVLVVEFWEGSERSCGHRCERASGPCSVRPLRTLVEESLGGMSADDRASALRFLCGRQPLLAPG